MTDETEVELDETLQVTLSNVQGSAICTVPDVADGLATGTIEDDDATQVNEVRGLAQKIAEGSQDGQIHIGAGAGHQGGVRPATGHAGQTESHREVAASTERFRA